MLLGPPLHPSSSPFLSQILVTFYSMDYALCRLFILFQSSFDIVSWKYKINKIIVKRSQFIQTHLFVCSTYLIRIFIFYILFYFSYLLHDFYDLIWRDFLGFGGLGIVITYHNRWRGRTMELFLWWWMNRTAINFFFCLSKPDQLIVIYF